ncbi:MAG TPA: YdcF family protein [Calidithermus sp.]|nr:YdcF family protein [Calidithermus sp.]
MRSALRGLGAAAVAGFLLTAFTPLAAILSRALALAGPLQPAQAIVVLGGGGVRADGALTDTSLRRTWRGLELYRAGLAPLLVLAGPRTPEGPVEAEVRAALVGQCGVPAEAVLTAPQGRTTREEAVAIGRLLSARGIHRIILVADAEGMRRAAAAFARQGFAVVPAPAADVPALTAGPEERLEVMRRVVLEALALVYYRAAGYL